MIKGIDLSHWQADVDFGTLKNASGIRFVALKATQGAANKDATFPDRRTRAEEVGFEMMIYYHFFDPSSSAESQADNFVQSVGSIAHNEFVCIDVEQIAGYGNSSDDVSNIVEWVARVKAALGTVDAKFFLYGSPAWLRGQFSDQLSRLTFLKLWAAEYGVKQLGDVQPWADAEIWQNSERASIDGAGDDGAEDSDVYLDEANFPPAIAA